MGRIVVTCLPSILLRHRLIAWQGLLVRRLDNATQGTNRYAAAKCQQSKPPYPLDKWFIWWIASSTFQATQARCSCSSVFEFVLFSLIQPRNQVALTCLFLERGSNLYSHSFFLLVIVQGKSTGLLSQKPFLFLVMENYLLNSPNSNCHL